MIRGKWTPVPDEEYNEQVFTPDFSIRLFSDRNGDAWHMEFDGERHDLNTPQVPITEGMARRRAVAMAIAMMREV